MPNTIAQNLQRLIDAKTAIADAITTMGGTVSVGDGLEDFALDISTIPSGGGGATILNGTTDPTSDLGDDGDIYLKTSNEVAESVTFVNPVIMQLDYCCDENSVIEFDCSLPNPVNWYDTPWGSRDNTDYFIAYNGGVLRYNFAGTSGNVGDISSYYNQRIKITLSKTYCKMEYDGSEIYNVPFTGGSATATTKLGLFTLFTDNSGGDMGECRSNGTLYAMKIYENGVLVRNYVPYIYGSTYCVINTLTGDIFYPLHGTLTGTTTIGDTYNIIDSSVKVNSTWQPLIGSDIDDVNTSGGGGGSNEGKVRFIDYDGTVFRTYTLSQFAQLESYPAPPSHEYLTFNEYNWTLSNAKTYVAKYGSLNIGATYNTSDGKTRMFITVRDGRLNIGLQLGVNGTVDVDWGDGSAHDTMSGSDVSTTQLTSHAYSTAGDYIIALTASGSVSIVDGFLCEPTGVTDNRKYVYRSILNSIFIGNKFGIGSSAFSYCYTLTSITIPDTVTSIGTSAFIGCNGLGYIRFESETPPTVANSNVFKNIPTDCIIYVPSTSLSAYKSATNYPSSTTYTYIGY